MNVESKRFDIEANLMKSATELRPSIDEVNPLIKVFATASKPRKKEFSNFIIQHFSFDIRYS
jgi:hypothetical protein